jgi:hypothetical protein
MASILQNLIKQHSGKWYEVVVWCKPIDDPGEVRARFISATDALWYANRILEINHGQYTLIVVR